MFFQCNKNTLMINKNFSSVKIISGMNVINAYKMRKDDKRFKYDNKIVI